MTRIQQDMRKHSWAVLGGPDDIYRYRLGRRWDTTSGHPCDVWIMLNPSTADALRDDPTVRRCMAFSRAWGAGGIVVVNLYALRATDPHALIAHPDPIGSDNDREIADVVGLAREEGGRVLAAWGSHPMAALRGRGLRRTLPGPLLCLGHTKDRSPRHPLYVPASATPITWRPW